MLTGLQTLPTYSAGDKGGLMLERSDMPNVLHSAVEPGASRCSEKATGSKDAPGSRRAMRGARKVAFFDPAPADLATSRMAGVSAAGELLKRARAATVAGRDYPAQQELRIAIEEACQAMAAAGDASQRHAAYAFMEMMASMVAAAACLVDLDRFLSFHEGIALAETNAIQRFEHRKREALGERMRLVRAAKSAKRADPQAFNAQRGAQ